ncbi:hypothetical protein KCV04_g29, partial [Aureobasidium melanogenum]
MSADSPHEIIRCEPSSRDGFAAKPENNNRRIRGEGDMVEVVCYHGFQLITLTDKSPASSRSSLKRKEIQMKEYNHLKDEIWRFAVARDHTQSDLIMLKEMLEQALMASKPKLKSSALYFSLIAVLNVVVTLLVWHTKKVRLAAEHNPLAPIVESEPNSNGFVSVLQVGLWIASGLMGIHTLYSSCGHLLLKSRITQVARLQRAIEASEITEATCDTLQYPIRDALFTIQLWLVRRCGRQFDLDFHISHTLVDMQLPTLI